MPNRRRIDHCFPDDFRDVSISTSAFLRVLAPALLAPVLVLVVSYCALNWAKELILQRAMAAEVATETMPIARRPAPTANTFDAGREEIRARIVLHEHGLVHGGDLYSLGVELENQSLGNAAWVEFDAQDVKLEFIDESGQKRFNAGYEAWHLKPGQYQVNGSVLVRVAFSQKASQDNVPFARDQPKLKLTIPSVKIVVTE